LDEKSESNQNKKKDEDEEDLELQKIRLRKMQQYIQMKKQSEEQKREILTLQNKIDMILKVLMQPDAYKYYKEIEKRDEKLFQQITSMILPPQVINEIDLLMSYLSQGMLRTGMIDLTEIQYIERQILGIGPQIIIKKRKQEAKSLNSFLKEE